MTPVRRYLRHDRPISARPRAVSSGNLCVHDLLDRHPRMVTGPAVYVRFHGAGERYGGSFSKDHIRRWADWMGEAAGSQRVVYALFNNDAAAHAVYNALTLREMLG